MLYLSEPGAKYIFWTEVGLKLVKKEDKKFDSTEALLESLPNYITGDSLTFKEMQIIRRMDGRSQ